MATRKNVALKKRQVSLRKQISPALYACAVRALGTEQDVERFLPTIAASRPYGLSPGASLEEKVRNFLEIVYNLEEHGRQRWGQEQRPKVTFH